MILHYSDDVHEKSFMADFSVIPQLKIFLFHFF